MSSSLDIQEAPIALTPESSVPHHASRHVTTTTTTTTTTAKTPAPGKSDKSEPRTLYMGGRMRLYNRTQYFPTDDPEINEGAVRRRAVTFQETQSDEKRHSTTVELAHIDQEDVNNSRPLKDSKEEITEHADPDPEATHIHVRTWTDRMHGNRPDRHLFPYRSMKENIHAARTFLRRFFFLFLIIPAWVIPYVLTAKANHALETSSAGEGNTTTSNAALEYAGLKYVTLATSTSSEEEKEGPDLGKTAFWIIFLLNLLVMMHLGKAAGRALEELVPRFGMVCINVLLQRYACPASIFIPRRNKHVDWAVKRKKADWVFFVKFPGSTKKKKKKKKKKNYFLKRGTNQCVNRAPRKGLNRIRASQNSRGSGPRLTAWTKPSSYFFFSSGSAV
ncbi:hypothetical protein EDD21DRAFT_362472 [Dissophora ornata]|nr:hypothetical protein EDD21DRAFT_362472 [Dissophora ornata]